MTTTTATTEKLITALEERGFKRWTKGDKDRMYIDAEKLGLKVQKYGSGAVKRAEWDGEKISNHEGTAMLHAKTYLDLTNMSVHSDDSDLLAAAEAIIEEIRASLEEEEKKEEKEAAMSTTAAATAMQELYQGISYDARMDYCTKEMAQSICRHTLAKEAERRCITDPSMMNPATGSVDKLSGWICDYMELTPEEWGGITSQTPGLSKSAGPRTAVGKKLTASTGKAPLRGPRTKRRKTVIYINNTTPGEYITADYLRSLPREEREAYHVASAQELSALIDSAETWDAVDPDAYRHLAYLLDLDTSTYEDCEAFMAAVKKVMEAPHA
uniref:Uncharacterized protein n=1 Tax=Podoviridae sp. ctFbF42 TaxID=2825233 RepID=A0A8S5PXV6_9CAUD|nr:MAG TPA: hypothetical protein [Podoviridae sp. ctFbF42]